MRQSPVLSVAVSWLPLLMGTHGLPCTASILAYVAVFGPASQGSDVLPDPVHHLLAYNACPCLPTLFGRSCFDLLAPERLSLPPHAPLSQ